MAINGLGDAAAIISGEIIMNQLKWDWSIYILLSVTAVFIFAFLTYTCLDEVETEHHSSNLSTLEVVSHKVSRLKLLMKSPKHAFLVLDFVFVESIYENILLWYPLFFSLVSYSQYSSAIAISFIFMEIVGAWSFETLIEKVTIISANQYVLGFLFCLTLLHAIVIIFTNSEQSLIIYFLLSGLSGFFLGGPLARIGSSESI